MSDIMDGLAALAAPLVPQTYAFPVEAVTVPCVVVGYPDVVYDHDVWTLPVYFLVGAPDRVEARDALSLILTEAASIKEAFDGAHAWGDVRVTDASIEEVKVSAVSYLAARFNVEVLS
jgi:hypothetical protein